MNEALAHLKDIEGLAAISWWPLAPGWWGAMIIFILILLVFSIYYYRKRAFERSWRKAILNQLFAMEQNLLEVNAQATITDLSELMRRIAIHQYARAVCAGLEGKSWLAWLTKHDPHQFDWETKGKGLIEAPYAPSGASLQVEEVRDLIKATRKWVK
jgi:hypothetical protein